MDYRGYRGDEFKLPERFARRRYLLQPLGRLMMISVPVLAFMSVLKMFEISIAMFMGCYVIFVLGWTFNLVGESYNTRFDKGK